MSQGIPVLIWGAGAMGGTIGAALIRAGHAVWFVDVVRDHVVAINDRGLEIQGPVAHFRVEAQAYLPDQLTGRFERILLCVKAHHTVDATEALRPFLAPDGFVVSVQNGLNEPLIADVVGPERTVGAFVNFGADYLEPGVIHWGGRGAVVLGELDGAMTDRLGTLHGLLKDFEPNAGTTDNIFGFLWGKLAYAALLFSTALTNESIADVLDSSRHRPVLVELAREVCQVAEARGTRLEGFDGFDPQAFGPRARDVDAIHSLDELVAFNRRSAKTHSGIWRDLAVRRRPTEVDVQLGPVVAEAKRLRIPTPLLEAVIAQIHEIEDGSRPLSVANLDDLMKTRTAGDEA
ncbi:MAG: 2-dehydropantoate 2-reductase [Gemmatimonadota bacterium]|nr:2-dehydropantoate 2-reductase [Gemmatimonadota bacterium]